MIIELNVPMPADRILYVSDILAALPGKVIRHAYLSAQNARSASEVFVCTVDAPSRHLERRLADAASVCNVDYVLAFALDRREGLCASHTHAQKFVMSSFVRYADAIKLGAK